MYLDAKGLVAVWRETLLAQKVLRGETRGYREHPQLHRFKASSDPIGAIASYLHAICDEADARTYSFDRSRIVAPPAHAPLTVTQGQLEYEWRHLLAKLLSRDPERRESYRNVQLPEPHPLFTIVPGDVADWEKRVD
jgi:hypothetical protein